MKTSLFTLLASLILLPFCTHAQRITLTSAISTDWSGGVAGRHGTSYVFVVEFSKYGAEAPLPDTLWLGNKCIPLIAKTATGGRAFNLVAAKKKQKITYTITAGTSNADDPTLSVQDPFSNNSAKALPAPKPPVAYKGVALLCYSYQGARHYYTIARILTHGDPVNYP
jgi:hypothetical protein